MDTIENVKATIWIDGQSFTRADLEKSGWLCTINGREYVDVTTWPLKYAPPKKSFLEGLHEGFFLNRFKLVERQKLWAKPNDDEDYERPVEVEGYKILNTTIAPAPIIGVTKRVKALLFNL